MDQNLQIAEVREVSILTLKPLSVTKNSGGWRSVIVDHKNNANMACTMRCCSSKLKRALSQFLQSDVVGLFTEICLKSLQIEKLTSKMCNYCVGAWFDVYFLNEWWWQMSSRKSFSERAVAEIRKDPSWSSWASSRVGNTFRLTRPHCNAIFLNAKPEDSFFSSKNTFRVKTATWIFMSY